MTAVKNEIVIWQILYVKSVSNPTLRFSVNVKRTWVNYGLSRDWADSEQGQGEEFLYHATQVKNVWLTMGDIFAN